MIFMSDLIDIRVLVKVYLALFTISYNPNAQKLLNRPEVPYLILCYEINLKLGALFNIFLPRQQDDIINVEKD